MPSATKKKEKKTAHSCEFLINESKCDRKHGFSNLIIVINKIVKPAKLEMEITQFVIHIYVQMLQMLEHTFKIRIVTLDQFFYDIFFCQNRFGHPNRLKIHIRGCI